jgi:general stress protein 26
MTLAFQAGYRGSKLMSSVIPRLRISFMNPTELFNKILKENEICTLATASKSGKPEAATIEYAEDENHNLYFETFPNYRKYPNLKQNPRASVVINQHPHNIQMDGTVKELSEESEKAKQLCITKHGKCSGFYNDPNIRFFKFTPTWIHILTNPKYPPTYRLIKE